MKKAIIAKKIGMTQIFNENGLLVPVTVLEAGPCVVTQVKTTENDGYEAVQVGFGEVKENRVNKPMKGHFAKANVEPKKVLKEFRFDSVEGYEAGSEIKVDVFAAGDKVDATGISKGKKMAGHMGNVQVTIQNLEIVKADAEKNLLLVKGAVPGSKGSILVIKDSVKA